MARREELQYVIRIYVRAKSVADALRLAKKSPIHEVYVDPDWKAKQDDKADADNPLGFKEKKNDKKS